MSSKSHIDATSFSEDVLEFLRLLERHDVICLIVGGEAVIYHGYPRLTGDIDFFYQQTPENIGRLFRCLEEFWDGNVPGFRDAAPFFEEGLIAQFGRPPNRIDLLNKIDGIGFPEAWKGRETVFIEDNGHVVRVHYIGREALLKNKEASGRPKDLDDIQHIR